MSDLVGLTSDVADRLLAAVADMARGVVRSPPRVNTARSVIAAVAMVDSRLREIVDDLQSQLHADGVMVVILAEDQAHMVVIVGAEIVNAEVEDSGVAPAEDSYCKYSITMTSFQVDDSRLEPLLSGNRWVEQVRGYLGGVLVVQDFKVGAVCAVSDNPRQWTHEENRLIQKAATEISTIFERALLAYT